MKGTSLADGGSRLLNPMETVWDAQLRNGDTLLAVLMQHRLVATTGFDGKLSVWDITKTSPTLHKECKLMAERLLLAACISGDGNHILTGSAARVPKLWDAKQGEQKAAFRANADRVSSRHSGSVSCVDISPNGGLVASGGNDFVAKVWDIDGHLVADLIDHTLEVEDGLLGPRTHELQLHAVKFSPDSTRVATCSADCTAKIWDSRDGRCLHRLCHPEEAAHGMHAVTCVCWAPSCREVVSTSDRFVTSWCTQTGREVRTWEAHTNQVTSAAFSIEGSTLLTGSKDATAKVWDMENWICLRTLEFEGVPQEQRPAIVVVDIHPDGKHATTGYANGCTKVWEVLSGRCTHTLRRNLFPILMASFVPL